VYIPKKLNAVLMALTALGLGASTVGLAFGVGLIPLERATAAPNGSPARVLGIGARTTGATSLVAPEDKIDADPAKGAEALAAEPIARKAAPILVPASYSRTASTRVSRGAAGGWQSARASWYGPGFYGRRTASGVTLTQGMMNVAHRSMAFGTRIQFEYNGRTCVAVVNDRGPYVGGRTFDLGPGTAQALGFSGVGTVRYRVLGR